MRFLCVSFAFPMFIQDLFLDIGPEKARDVMMTALDITYKWELKEIKLESGQQYFEVGKFPVHTKAGSYRWDVYLKEFTSTELEFHVMWTKLAPQPELSAKSAKALARA